MMIKGEDGQMVECEIISTRDHESIFDKNAPVLPIFLAIICCILNLIPGKISMLLCMTFIYYRPNMFLSTTYLSK